jgi:hypothetical protein
MQGDRRWAVTLVVVLVVTLGALIGIAGLRLAQMRSEPMAFPRTFTGPDPARPEPAPMTGAGSPNVEVSGDAWADPSGRAVATLLSQYFDAINAKNYAAWTGTVTPATVTANPEASWRKEYATKTDGTIRLARIDQVSQDRYLALVYFVTAQAPQDGPEGLKIPQICWRVSFPLTGQPLKIDIGSKLNDVLLGACHA